MGVSEPKEETFHPHYSRVLLGLVHVESRVPHPKTPVTGGPWRREPPLPSSSKYLDTTLVYLLLKVNDTVNNKLPKGSVLTSRTGASSTQRPHSRSRGGRDGRCTSALQTRPEQKVVRGAGRDLPSAIGVKEGLVDDTRSVPLRGLRFCPGHTSPHITPVVPDTLRPPSGTGTDNNPPPSCFPKIFSSRLDSGFRTYPQLVRLPHPTRPFPVRHTRFRTPLSLS